VSGNGCSLAGSQQPASVIDTDCPWVVRPTAGVLDHTVVVTAARANNRLDNTTDLSALLVTVPWRTRECKNPGTPHRSTGRDYGHTSHGGRVNELALEYAPVSTDQTRSRHPATGLQALAIDVDRIVVRCQRQDARKTRPLKCPMMVGGFYESMQHLSVMRAFAPRLGGYLSGLLWPPFRWRSGLPRPRDCVIYIGADSTKESRWMCQIKWRT
jgi:hypothetical protein